MSPLVFGAAEKEPQAFSPLFYSIESFVLRGKGMKRNTSTPQRKPHTFTADLLTWSDTPQPDSTISAVHSTRHLQLNRFSSPARLTFSVNQTNHMLTPVYARAKRGFSSKDNKIVSSEDLRFELPLEIVKLADEMFDVMYKTDGIGLSAPQVGIDVQLMVFNPVSK
ncbi:ADP-ribosylation factor 1-like isoform X1 [Hibiscus syriacus]|uniref:Peptide deformylase n=1 Tax=Hibiscus syriacus TaxID=106335 RepID=A0A6A3CGA0_HIBSY|nr:ADP-ribosylation factor 1-like isoform X1 [Hibiscus syriacus]